MCVRVCACVCVCVCVACVCVCSRPNTHCTLHPWNYLHKHMQRQPHHDEVVDDHHQIQFERFSVTHQSRAYRAHNEISCEQSQHGPRGLHQEPVLGAGIWEINPITEPSFVAGLLHAKRVRTYRCSGATGSSVLWRLPIAQLDSPCFVGARI